VENISDKLFENTTYMQGLFENAMDFILRKFKLCDLDAAIMSMDGLVSKQQISISILNPLMQTTVLPDDGKSAMEYIGNSVLGAVDQMPLHTMTDVIDRLMNGFAVLFVDGCSYALCFGIQGFDVFDYSTRRPRRRWNPATPTSSRRIPSRNCARRPASI